MRLRVSDSTSEIDAEFELTDGEAPGVFVLTIESAGGARASGNGRNSEYPILVEELLRRLSGSNVDLIDALVDSNRVAHLPTEKRRIHVQGRPYPIPLRDGEDFSALRRGLTRPQAEIGSSRQIGGGNQRKRMRLELRATALMSRSELAQRLDAVESDARRKSGIAAGLSRSDLERAIAAWHGLGREAFLEKFKAPAARRYVVVDADDEIDAMAGAAHAGAAGAGSAVLRV